MACDGDNTALLEALVIEKWCEVLNSKSFFVVVLISAKKASVIVLKE